MDVVRILAEAGGVGIALAALFLFYHAVKEYRECMTELMTNHLQHNTEALVELVTIMREVKDCMECPVRDKKE